MVGEEEHFMKTKVTKAFVSAWRQFKHKKWFYKIDDDTFVVWHNLVKKLNNYDWRQVQYIGHRMGISLAIDCNGGAGYVFSRETLIELMPHYYDCMLSECYKNAEDQCTAFCVMKYLDGRLCTNDRGWIMSQVFLANRAPNCEEECVSIHYVVGSDVERFYRRLYADWEVQHKAYTNSTQSKSFTRS
jgi:hypothetical protein